MKKVLTVFLMIGLIALCTPCMAQVFPIQSESLTVAKLKGSGIVKFNGSGKISINGEGVIFIGEEGRVELVGLSNYFENDEDGKRVYILPDDSNVEIEGDDMEVSFYGADFGYIANVTGRSEISARGYGYYRVGLTMGVWTSDGIDLRLLCVK